MNKEKELILEELRAKKEKLQERAPKNIVVQNIKLLGTIQLNEVENNKEQEGLKTAKLYLVEEYNSETDKIMLKYYADDEFIGIENEGEFIPTGLAREKYKNSDSIKDVLENIEEKEKVQDDNKEKEKSQEVYDLNELEEEKEQEEKNKEKKKDEKEDGKNNITGQKPKGVIQRINPHKTYVNSIETVSNAFEISSEVDEIVIADTQSGDENALSDNKTIYMLDKDDKIIEESNGKKIDELFEYDDATGNNPMSDKNIKIELNGHAEINKGRTIARFKSKEKPGLDFSAERGRWGDYDRVYAGEKTRDGNVAVEVQLETDNVEVQTSLESQKVRDYGEGDYEKEEIAKEVEKHQKHGDDEEKIAIENADGEESTRVACESPFVPDTNITWEQFSKSVGNKDVNELMEEFFEQYKGDNGEELILKIQADYKEKENGKQTEEKEIEEEYEGRVPWDSTKH